MKFALRALAAAILVLAGPATAGKWDNEAGVYEIAPLPAASVVAFRLDQREQEDQVPVGRHAEAGDLLTVHVSGASGAVALTVGFREFWNPGFAQQVVPLAEGENRVVVTVGGPIALRHTGDAGLASATVTLSGGNVLPLYLAGDGKAAWVAEQAEHPDAPFVQVLAPRVVITLPVEVAAANAMADPEATLAAIGRLLALHDTLSGLDGATAIDAPSPLRQHFIVDLGAKPDDPFWMYATDGFVGLRAENAGHLLDPAILATDWGLWHELGHIHQQTSWTWAEATEITVNLWSLHAEEAYRTPPRLIQDEGRGSAYAMARDYLNRGAPDFAQPNEDYDSLFVRLVMFDQLQQAYGWSVFQDLARSVRRAPLPRDASDQDRVDLLVERLCKITGRDLRRFFAHWGLLASPSVLDRIGALALPEPAVPPDSLFRQ